MATTPAPTFGRRGWAAPAPLAAGPSAPPAAQAPPRVAAAPFSTDFGARVRSVLRICFSFQGRLDRNTYLTARSIWYAVNVFAFYELWRQILQAFLAHQIGAAAPWAMLALALIVVGQWVTLAMQVKRWHDRDRPAFWVGIGLVPVVGPIWTLVELMFLEGTPGPNRYGAPPKGDRGSVLA